ncbi:Co-chaperone GrpE family protein [Euphorbia peplus]|nr:Co-chaperone GrpE family protein [Euphorbia peplus]
MAICFSNSSLLSHPPSSVCSKTLEFKTQLLALHHLPRFSNSTLRLSRSLKPYYSTADSESSTNGMDVDHMKAASKDVKGEQVPSLKNLMRVYKKAILLGDQSIISEIEASVEIIENTHSQLAQKVSDLSAEINSGKEKHIRLQADFDNFRKRAEKERINVRSNAQGEVIESLLPMVDSFERAKLQLKPDTEMEKKIDTSYQGIYKQFVEIMRSLKVASVATVGKPFDPLLHEAIAREESEEYKEGIIIQEFRRGFRLGDRLLRPAMVKVSAGPGKKKAPVGIEQPATAASVDDR